MKTTRPLFNSVALCFVVALAPQACGGGDETGSAADGANASGSGGNHAGGAAGDNSSAAGEAAAGTSGSTGDAGTGGDTGTGGSGTAGAGGSAAGAGGSAAGAGGAGGSGTAGTGAAGAGGRPGPGDTVLGEACAENRECSSRFCWAEIPAAGDVADFVCQPGCIRPNQDAVCNDNNDCCGPAICDLGDGSCGRP